MRLITERLILRDPVRSDIKNLSRYHRDERYLEHYSSVPDTDAIIDLAIKWTNDKPRRNYQLVVESGSDVIGCVGLRTEYCKLGEGEVGLEFNPDYWGRGYAREALLAIIEFAQSLKIQTLRAETKRNNQRAIKLMESESFKLQKEIKDDVVMYLNIPVNA